MWWAVPESHERVFATSGHEALVEILLKLRGEGGSFRATEDGHYITKNQETSGQDWTPLYVCAVNEPLLFDALDPMGLDLQPGDLWTSFYDGARYSFRGDKVWWNDPETGMRLPAASPLPREIMLKLREYKTEGGRFVITEQGKVLSLVPPTPLPKRVAEQYKKLSPKQKNLLLVKKQTTEMLPIFIGEFLEGIVLKPPRRLGQPLSPHERQDFQSFLGQYGLDVAETHDQVEEAETDLDDDRGEA